MENSGTYFNFLAIAHALFGYFVVAIVSIEDLQKVAFYKDQNPLIGDIHKYLMYFSGGSLIGCAFFLMYSDKIVLLFAWASIAFQFLAAVAIPILSGLIPRFTKYTIIYFALRLLATCTLTQLYANGVRS